VGLVLGCCWLVSRSTDIGEDPVEDWLGGTLIVRTQVSFLKDILANVRAGLSVRQARVGLEELKRSAEKARPPRDAIAALSQPGVSVIAEVKRASPSKGHLADIDDPAALARQYVAGGASMVSVLTEPTKFEGSIEDLAAVANSVEVPVVCKDFILTSYQLWEARAAGADVALLIVAALDQNALVALIERAKSIGLTPLVEVHDVAELGRALEADAPMIGINARNLHSLEISRDSVVRLAPKVPSELITVAESGIRGPHDLLSYAYAGVDAVLVGQSLVTSADPQAMVQELVTAGAHPAAREAKS
jgi:indole-3-glycerol phosphate synthase